MINSSAPLREVTPASAMILFRRKRLIIRLSILDSLKGEDKAHTGFCAYFTAGVPEKTKEKGGSVQDEKN
jgi:hypothetical protein